MTSSLILGRLPHLVRFSRDPADMSSPIAEPAKRRGRPPKAAVPPGKEASASSNTAAPVKRGPGRPRKDASKVHPAPRRRIVQPEEEVDENATILVPPPKRGPGRPRKNAPKIAPASRRSIVQPEEMQPAEIKSHKKRSIEQVDAQVPTTMRDVNRQPKTRAVGTPEPPLKRKRRGLTNIFTSPLSSSEPTEDELDEALPELSMTGKVFQSQPSQPTPDIRKASNGDKDSIEVRRRTIVQLDDETVLQNYRAGLA